MQLEAGVVAWRVPRQLSVATAKSPLAVTAVMVSAAVPVFVTVRGRGAVVTPTGCVVLKAKVLDDKLTTGVPVPVPDKAVTCVLVVPLLLSVTVSAPYKLPVVVGVKFTAIVQVPLTATGTAVEQLVPAAAIPN